LEGGEEILLLWTLPLPPLLLLVLDKVEVVVSKGMLLWVDGETLRKKDEDEVPSNMRVVPRFVVSQ
jgi:hypothetical protein